MCACACKRRLVGCANPVSVRRVVAKQRYQCRDVCLPSLQQRSERAEMDMPGCEGSRRLNGAQAPQASERRLPSQPVCAARARSQWGTKAKALERNVFRNEHIIRAYKAWRVTGFVPRPSCWPWTARGGRAWVCTSCRSAGAFCVSVCMMLARAENRDQPKCMVCTRRIMCA